MLLEVLTKRKLFRTNKRTKVERNKVAEPYIIACSEITLRNKLLFKARLMHEINSKYTHAFVINYDKR